MRYNSTMSHQILFICGGAWSGKTDRAVDHARKHSHVVWIGTAANSIPGILEHIDDLKSVRPAHWINIDSPFDLSRSVAKALTQNTEATVVIDSVSQWIGNEIAKFSSRYDERQLAEKIWSEFEELCGQIENLRKSHSVILISSDFGQSLPPQDPLARALRMSVGRANQALSNIADSLEFMAAGVVIFKKNRGYASD